MVLPGTGQTTEGIVVKILDQDGKPLKGEAVSVLNSDYYQTDAKGEFILKEKRLPQPVWAEFRSDKLEVDEIAYFEEDGRLIIKGNRLYGPDDLLHIRFVLAEGEASLQESLQFRFKGNIYETGPDGKISFSPPLLYAESDLAVKGYEIKSKHFNSSAHTLQLVVEPLPAAVPFVADTVMLTYEADFERITREMEKERTLYEEKNQEIQEEILKIRDNLVHEEQISDVQRTELKRYLGNMEKVLQENSEVIRKSEERTKEAIAKLRMIIMEKDSLNLVAQGRIVQMQEEQAEAQENYQRRITIFSSIIVALLIVALTIYFFAAKLRRQKKWLGEVNRRLKAMQSDLTGSLKELNLRKAQIEEHNNELELFVYKASHDIKGPLRSIIGLTQIGIHDVKDSVAQEYFGHIQKSTQRLDNLLADLLRLTKAKQAEVEKQPLNLPVMVSDIVHSFKNIRYFDKVRIEVDIQEELLFESDEKMIYSIIQNFVENGIKYCDPTKEDPFLHISVRREEDKTIFLFRDNGLGVEEEHLPKIFDMFYKINPNSDGTGLGLHIVKVTIEKLGGTIKVNSRSGSGSLFTLTFYD